MRARWGLIYEINRDYVYERIARLSDVHLTDTDLDRVIRHMETDLDDEFRANITAAVNIAIADGFSLLKLQ